MQGAEQHAYPHVDMKKASGWRLCHLLGVKKEIGKFSFSVPTSCDRGRDTTSRYDRF